MTVTILTIDTPSLGDRSYLVHDGEVAFVVDPQRDIDRVLALAERDGVRITHVFETHIHNDYVTGGLRAGQATGAAYHVNADDPVSLRPRPDPRRRPDRRRRRDDACASIAPPATPSPTCPTCCEERDGEPVRGVLRRFAALRRRPGDQTCSAPITPTTLAHHQYASALALAELPDPRPPSMPTHGFGSFCSADATTAGATASTIGQERRANPALTQDERGLGRRPSSPGWTTTPPTTSTWRRGTSPARRARPVAAGGRRRRRELRTPARRRGVGRRPADPDRIRRRARPRHLNFGLDGQFATYLGWLIPWGTSADPARRRRPRRSPRRSASWSASASTGRPQPRPAARRLDRRSRSATIERATFADLAQVRHHRRSGRARRTARGRSGGAGHVAGRCAHPAARAPRPARRGARRARSGCTAPRGTAPPSPRPCSRPSRPDGGARRRLLRHGGAHLRATPGHCLIERLFDRLRGWSHARWSTGSSRRAPPSRRWATRRSSCASCGPTAWRSGDPPARSGGPAPT